MLKKRIISATVAVALLISLVGCNITKKQTFAEFTEEYFRDVTKSSIVSLNFTLKNPEDFGIDEYDVKLADYSIDDMEEAKAETEEVYNKLKAFDYSKLTEEEQLTFDIFEYTLKQEKLFNDLYINFEPLSPSNGAHTNYPYYLTEFRFYDKEQNVKDFLELLTQFDQMFDEIMIIENERVKAGIFMQDSALTKVVEQAQGFIDETPNSIVVSFNERIDAFNGLDNAKKQQYKDECKKLIETEVIPAYKSLIEQLNKLKGSAKTSGALCETDAGKKYYEYLYKAKTGAIHSPNALAKLIENDLEETYTKIGTIASQNKDSFDRYLNIKNPESDPSKALLLLKEAMKEDFPEGEDVDFQIKSFPKSQEDNGAVATYFYNAIDDKSKNSIYINNALLDPEKVGTFITIAHEGFPGHMYQMNYFKNTDPMLVRHAFDFVGYAEGWTTYIEGYAAKYAADGDENAAMLIAMDQTIGFLIYARADIGIHYEGWTYEELVKFVSDLFPEDVAKLIYDDIIATPGNFLPYGGGYAEMTDLREFTEEKLGDKFDEKEFHRVVLETGSAPYDIVKRELIKYIDTINTASDAAA